MGSTKMKEEMPPAVESRFWRRARLDDVNSVRRSSCDGQRDSAADVNQVQQIADAYRAATIKGAWYGPSLAELLAKTSPEMATTPPVREAHTIAALLQHLLLWNERIRNTSATRPLPRWEPEKEWAEPPIPWDELLARWNRSRDLLEARLRGFPVEDLAKQVPGRAYPYEMMLQGIVQHVIYHSGQIAMILSMLRQRTGAGT